MAEEVGRPVAVESRSTLAVLAGRLLILAAGVGAAVPVIVATVHAVNVGWVPGADQAIIATRGHDVFSSHMPLVGQYTTAWAVTGRVTRDLGPMLYWLVAVPARFGSAASLTVTMGAMNTLAIVGCVALARRRGGRVLMFATAAAIALMCRSLAAETFHDVWNASAGLLPFTLLIFLCWSLACGDHRLLPLAVLVASYVAQVHLMYVAPALGLLIIGVGGVALARIVRRRRAAAAGSDVGARGGSLVRWALAAVAVGCICWSPTVVEEVSHHPGNLTRVIETATQRNATLGTSVGWHAVVRAVGFPRPWWLYSPAWRYDRKHDVRVAPSSLRTVSCLALLAALAIVAVAGLVRRRGDLTAAAVIGFVLCAALGAVAAATPTPRLLSATLGYTMWWGSQVGMWVWLILAWSAGLVLVWAGRLARSGVRGRVRARAPRIPSRVAVVASVAASLAGVAGTATVGSAVAAAEGPDEHVALYGPIASLVARLHERIPSGRTVLLKGKLDVSSMPIKPALRYFLVRRGIRVLGEGSYPRLGSWYELDHRPYQSSIYVVDRARSPAKHTALIGRATYTDGWGRHTVTVWVGPGSARSPHPATRAATAPAAARSAPS